jgi:aryl-alcohol dehydrogenase-like predicted oxidoreductase
LGHSEEVVARALGGRSGRPYVFNKCSLVWNDKAGDQPPIKGGIHPARMRKQPAAVEVDTIDLYQVHWPDPDRDLEEGWRALAELQKQGKVRWVAVSNFNLAQIKRRRQIAPITSLQPPYSVISPEAEDQVLPYCLQHNIGVIVYSPMKSGLLTGKMTGERVMGFPDDDFRRKALSFQEPHLSCNLELAKRLSEIGARHGRTTGEVAIAWTLRHPAVTAAIVGMRSADQVTGAVGALDFRLTDSEIQEIAAFRQGQLARSVS